MHGDEETELPKRIPVDPSIFAGRPSIRGRLSAAEHSLATLAAGDGREGLGTSITILPPATDEE